jgi:hypothetical protein
MLVVPMVPYPYKATGYTVNNLSDKYLSKTVKKMTASYFTNWGLHLLRPDTGQKVEYTVVQ